MGQPEVIYVVDTSSWLRIKGHPESYRILDRSGQLVERGAISDPREVFEELKELSDAVSCVKQNKEGSVRRQMTDVEYLLAAGQVQYAFPAMGGATSGKNKADPYVVALGKFMLNAGTKCVVVANETIRSRPNRKIPAACVHFGLEFYDLIGMLRAEFPEDGW